MLQTAARATMWMNQRVNYAMITASPVMKIDASNAEVGYSKPLMESVLGTCCVLWVVLNALRTLLVGLGAKSATTV